MKDVVKEVSPSSRSPSHDKAVRECRRQVTAE
jgi:hypothetical protein